MSEGMCDFSIKGDYDGDVPSFYNEKIVTARKPHKCNECGEMIQPREQYQKVSGKWEGDFDSFNFCLPCVEITGEFVDGVRSFGTLWDELESNWESGAHLQACLNRLTSVAAKERMRQKWMKWKGLDELMAADTPRPAPED